MSMHALCGFPSMLRHLSSELPLHAIVGSQSDCVQPAQAERYRPMFPHARVELIEGAGHWVHADRPQALLDSLRRALADADRAPRPAAAARRRRPAARPPDPAPRHETTALRQMAATLIGHGTRPEASTRAPTRASAPPPRHRDTHHG
jgi:hypothetical protein